MRVVAVVMMIQNQSNDNDNKETTGQSDKKTISSKIHISQKIISFWCKMGKQGEDDA